MSSKYTEAQVKALGAKGHAFRNPDGGFSYPVDDAEDLDNAIRAVGRGGADHDAIRKYIIGRAKALGLSSKIPDNWGADGSLGGSASAQRDPKWEQRRRRWAGSLVGQRSRRSMPFVSGCVEVRAKPDGTGGTNFEFRGYGARFSTPFDMWDRWGDPYDEEVEPGTFTRTLARPDLDTPFLIGHNDAGIPLARTRSGTMRLSQDSQGLEALVPSMDGRNSEVRNLASAVERGDMDEMSIGFVTVGQRWSEDWSKRYLTDLELHRGDVSVVALAANPATAGASMTALPTEVLSKQAAAARAAEQRMPTTPYVVHKNEDNQCGQCKSMNDRDASFCDQCGAKMSPTGPASAETGGDETHQCGSCLSMNATDAKYCDQCGTELAGVRPYKKPGGGYVGDGWSSVRPGEQRGNPVDQDLGDSSDYDPWDHAAPGTIKCGSDGCPVDGGALNHPGSKFCSQCGADLWGGDALVRLNDDGVPAMEEEQGEAATLALRRRKLRLLALVK